MSSRNVVVAQSGGPTCVINNSLRGIVEACRDYPGTFGAVYAGRFGIEGVLKEELVDLTRTSAEEIALVADEPGGGVDRDLPVQAEEGPGGGLRAGGGGAEGPRRGVLLLHRRQ